MKSGGTNARTKRRWLLPIGVIASVAVPLLLGVIAYNVLLQPKVDPVKDKTGETVVLQRLSAAKGDLNAVRDPVNSEAESAARASGCGVDSGEVFEPELYREWRLSGPAKGVDILHTTEGGKLAARAITKALIARGWNGSAELDQDAATDLTKSFGGHQIHLVIQVDGESVLADGHTAHARVCRSHL